MAWWPWVSCSSYLGGRGVAIYHNQSGNGWAGEVLLPDFPPVSDIASINVVDLLGNGTACLVWASPLPSDGGRQMRYVDLMGSQKPHLLIGLRNNLGAETRIRYASSVKFYIQDYAADALHVPPVVTKTWFHTGAWPDEETIAQHMIPYDVHISAGATICACETGNGCRRGLLNPKLTWPLMYNASRES